MTGSVSVDACEGSKGFSFSCCSALRSEQQEESEWVLEMQEVIRGEKVTTRRGEVRGQIGLTPIPAPAASLCVVLGA